MEGIFSFALLFLLVLVIVVVGAAIYYARRRRRGEEVPSERPTTPSERPSGSGRPTPESTEAAAPPTATHEYFKAVRLEAGEEMKMRLYSLDEYEGELGGDARCARERHFVAALRAYRPVEDDWFDYPPERAADVLELTPEEYEVDRERGALLLKRLPRGLPESARDVL